MKIRRYIRISFSIATVIHLCFALPLLSQTWDIEAVEKGKMFSDMSNRYLRLDSAGQPHVAYGGYHLYYAWYDGTSWHYYLVDQSPFAGRNASLAMDNQDYPHIAYMDGTYGELMYAHQNETGWHIQTVDADAIESFAQYPSITLDDTGYPHITYAASDGSGDVTPKYAFLTDSGWQFESLNILYSGLYASLDLNYLGYPSMSFLGSDGGSYTFLSYARKTGSGWSYPSLGPGGAGAGWYTSMLLDDISQPHIAHISSDFTQLRYTYVQDSAWITEIAAQGDCIEYSVLDMDSADSPHIIYFDAADNDLELTKNNGTGWQQQTIDPEGGMWSSLVIDDSDYHQVVHYNPDDHILKYVHEDESGWHIDELDREVRVGEYASMAMDDQGALHISYFDEVNGNLKYALGEAETWHIETVDASMERVGYWSSLALDSLGFPRISYRDDTAKDLKYAFMNETGWHILVVDSTGDVGDHTSMSVDGEGFSHISYYDVMNNDLKYAYEDGSEWHVQTIDETGFVGSYSSLAIDAMNSLHISYYDESNCALKYAYCNGTEWLIETVDSNGMVGTFTTLAIDIEGFPHIGYRGSLRYAHKDTAGWHIEELNMPGGFGSSLSLVLDQWDYPHMSCRDVTNKDLIYVYDVGSGWNYRVIDTLGDVGSYSTLLLDGNGNAYISYYDNSSKSLKVARGIQAIGLELTAEITGGEIQLSWLSLPVFSAYWIFGETNHPWLIPDAGPGYENRIAILPAGSTSWSSPAGIGDPDNNWTYIVVGVDATDQELGRSNRAGELDYEITAP